MTDALCNTSSTGQILFLLVLLYILPAGNKSAAACEQWWLYWRFLTEASQTVLCTNSQLLTKKNNKKEAKVGREDQTNKSMLRPRYNPLPCSSLTAHTMRSTQAALAWQRSLRGLRSPVSAPVSCSTRCSSDWLLLNCSRTKSWTSRTNAGCTAGENVRVGHRIYTWLEGFSAPTHLMWMND